MKKKKTFRNIALTTASMTLVSAIPFQAVAAYEEQGQTTSIELKNADIRLAVGESQTLKAVADFLEDKNNSSTYKIEWSVNEEGKKVLSVDSRGKVTAKAAGKAEITAILKGETNLKATVSVEVYSTVTALNVKNKVINLRVGELLPIEYQVSPNDSIQQDVKFVSDSTSIAKVDKKGVVTGISEGEAKILVSTLDAGPEPFTKPILEEVTVNVTSTVTGVNITNVPNKKLELKSDETFQLKWDVLPSTAFLKDVTFKSLNPKAATVNSKGIIIGTKLGGNTKIEITTKDGKYIDTIDVAVDGTGNSGIPLTSIAIEADQQKNNQKFIDLFVGEETSLKVAATPKEVNLSRTLLAFEAEDPSIVEVLPSGKMTALKPGTTKVKVSYKENDKIYDEVTVTVKSTVTGIKGDAKWTLRVGEIAQPPVNVLPVETAQNKDLLISHDGKDIIRIVKKTEIEALKAGVVNATFISEDGGYEHQMQITIVSTVTSFKIPFETVKIGLDPYQFEPEFNKDAFLKEVKYEIADKNIISINAKTNTITPKSEGKTKVRAVTVDGQLVDEFEVVVDYEAKQISIYDEKNKLISSSDAISKPSTPNGNNTNTTEIRRMILEKLLEKADSSIVREVIKRLLNKL